MLSLLEIKDKFPFQNSYLLTVMTLRPYNCRECPGYDVVCANH